MANTKYSLFPFSTISKNDFTVYPVSIEFKAPLVAGKYVFSASTTPAKVFGELLQGEHGFVVRNFVAGRYRCIRWYFAVRNQIRNAVRRIKKR